VHAVGLFRIRVSRDGAVDIWAKGWRLESQVLALVPVLIAAGFLFSPFPMPIRAFGAAMLLVCARIVLRMSRLGLRIDLAGIQVTDVARTHRVLWDRFDGFVGERNEHEAGACCSPPMVSGSRLPALSTPTRWIRSGPKATSLRSIS